jgi:phosphoenolpyruvate carboxykinase (ATP)
MDLPHTRALVHAALNGSLEGVSMRTDPHFGFAVPEHCPGVPNELLNPRNTWHDPVEYDRQAQALAQRFKDNFTQFAASMPSEILSAGPG